MSLVSATERDKLPKYDINLNIHNFNYLSYLSHCGILMVGVKESFICE